MEFFKDVLCSKQFLDGLSNYEPHSLRNTLYHAALFVTDYGVREM
jgi:hypothetical protein